MSDQPLTLAVLAQFHREVFLPDFQRIVDEAIAGSERRMQANFDAILRKLDKFGEGASARLKSRVDQ